LKIFRLSYFLLLLHLASCGGSSAEKNKVVVNETPIIEAYTYQLPADLSDGWQVAHLDDFDISAQPLIQMMDDINNKTYKNIDSVLIIRNNTLVFEAQIRESLNSYDDYVNNTDIAIHSLQSVSKSFASALVGIAIDQHLINSEENNLYDFFHQYNDFDNWDDKKSQITLKNVLTMRHGWQWDEWSHGYSDSRNSLGEIYRHSPDHVKGLLDLPMASTPGSTYSYSTIASVALGAAVETSVQMQLEDFAEQYLFEPIGITTAIWAFTPVGRAHTGGGLWLGQRDMAKFGQLYLNKGRWDGQQIISEDWINRSTKRHVLFDYGHSDGYGYQWWMKEFKLENGTTIDSFSAQGNGGQFIYVLPTLNAVVVFTGGNYNSQLLYQPVELMTKYVLPAFN